ncbi:TRAPP II complex, Trs65, partial [Kipferlia bialata]
ALIPSPDPPFVLDGQCSYSLSFIHQEAPWPRRGRDALLSIDIVDPTSSLSLSPAVSASVHSGMSRGSRGTEGGVEGRGRRGYGGTGRTGLIEAEYYVLGSSPGVKLGSTPSLSLSPSTPSNAPSDTAEGETEREIQHGAPLSAAAALGWDVQGGRRRLYVSASLPSSVQVGVPLPLQVVVYNTTSSPRSVDLILPLSERERRRIHREHNLSIGVSASDAGQTSRSPSPSPPPAPVSKRERERERAAAAETAVETPDQALLATLVPQASSGTGTSPAYTQGIEDREREREDPERVDVVPLVERVSVGTIPRHSQRSVTVPLLATSAGVCRMPRIGLLDQATQDLSWGTTALLLNTNFRDTIGATNDGQWALQAGERYCVTESGDLSVISDDTYTYTGDRDSLCVETGRAITSNQMLVTL